MYQAKKETHLYVLCERLGWLLLLGFCITLNLDLRTHWCGLLINTVYKNHVELNLLHKTAFPILMLLSVSRQAKIINNRYQEGLGGVPWSPWRSSFLCCSFSFTPSAHEFVSLPITHSQTRPGAGWRPADALRCHLLAANPEWMATCCRLMGVHIYSVGFKDLDRSGLKLGSHTLAPQKVSPEPSITYMKLWQGSSFILKVHETHYTWYIELTVRQTGSAEHGWCPTAREHCRASSFCTGLWKLCSEKPRRGWKIWRHHFQFALKTGRAKSLHTCSRMPASLPCKSQQRLSRFSFCYPSLTRQTSKWQHTVLVIKMFCCWYILLKSCGIFYLRQ